MQIFQILGFFIIPIIYLIPFSSQKCKNKNIVSSCGQTLVKSKTVKSKDMCKSMQQCQTGGGGGGALDCSQSPIFTQDRQDRALCIAGSHLG